MTPPRLSRVLVDTNVLVSATDASRAQNLVALAALEEWPSQGIRLYTSTQVLREYLVVATRPTAANGLGLTLGDALINVSQFTRVVQVLPDTHKTWEELWAILSTSTLTGTRIHDANIAACARAHGIETILTANTADFADLPVATEELA